MFLGNRRINPCGCDSGGHAKIASGVCPWEKGGVNIENGPLCKHDCTLDNILQLADVSRPGIVHQQIHRFLLGCLNLAAKFSREALEKKTDELRNIGTAIPNRRKPEPKNVKSQKAFR